jgi:hypothetical protein
MRRRRLHPRFWKNSLMTKTDSLPHFFLPSFLPLFSGPILRERDEIERERGIQMKILNFLAHTTCINIHFLFLKFILTCNVASISTFSTLPCYNLSCFRASSRSTRNGKGKKSQLGENNFCYVKSNIFFSLCRKFSMPWMHTPSFVLLVTTEREKERKRFCDRQKC